MLQQRSLAEHNDHAVALPPGRDPQATLLVARREEQSPAGVAGSTLPDPPQAAHAHARAAALNHFRIVLLQDCGTQGQICHRMGYMKPQIVELCQIVADSANPFVPGSVPARILLIT